MNICWKKGEKRFMPVDLKRHLNPTNKKGACVDEPQDIADYGDRKCTILRNQGDSISILWVRINGVFCDFRGCGGFAASASITGTHVSIM